MTKLCISQRVYFGYILIKVGLCWWVIMFKPLPYFKGFVFQNAKTFYENYVGNVNISHLSIVDINFVLCSERLNQFVSPKQTLIRVREVHSKSKMGIFWNTCKSKDKASFLQLHIPVIQLATT